MTDTKDLHKILHNVDFFRDFSREEIDQLLRVSQWIKIDSGRSIISEGGDDLYLYVLVKGQVNVVKKGKTLATINAGDIFGEISALAKSPRTAHVIARNECFCVRFEPQLLGGLPTELELKLVKKILFTLAYRLTALNRRFTTT